MNMENIYQNQTTEINDEINQSEEVNDTSIDDEDLEFDGDDEETSNENKNEEVNKKQPSNKKEQTAEEKRLAFQKRQEEKEKKRLLEERKKIEQEHFEKGIIKGAGGVNKFTGEKLVTKHDIEDYMLMLEMEEKGLNPDDGFAVLKYKREKQIELEQKQLQEKTEQQKMQEFMDNDIKTFTKERPNVNIQELFNDEEFKIFSEKLLGKVPLVDIYDTFEKLNIQTESKADKLARTKLAKSLSSPKGLGSAGETSTKSFKDMSDAEFEKYIEAAKAGKLSNNY